MNPSGLLIIDKEEGPTSHDVVAMVRHDFQVRRAGHAGTLDPFATGVLVVLVERATKLAEFLHGQKTYLAEVSWGSATDTMDKTGKAIERTDKPMPPREEVERALAAFVGEVEQVPPMFSARKINGRRLYKLARNGIEVERKPTLVRIDQIRMTEWQPEGFSFHISCSKGTYIRTLADSLGRALGGLAHLRGLRRLSSGPFRIEEAHTLTEIRGTMPKPMDERREYLENLMVPMEKAMPDYPLVVVEVSAVRQVLNGCKLALDRFSGEKAPDGRVRIEDGEGRLLAVGRVNRERNTMDLLRVLAQNEESQGKTGEEKR